MRWWPYAAASGRKVAQIAGFRSNAHTGSTSVTEPRHGAARPLAEQPGSPGPGSRVSVWPPAGLEACDRARNHARRAGRYPGSPASRPRRRAARQALPRRARARRRAGAAHSRSVGCPRPVHAASPRRSDAMRSYVKVALEALRWRVEAIEPALGQAHPAIIGSAGAEDSRKVETRRTIVGTKDM